MPSYTNTTPATPIGSATYNLGAATLRGGQFYVFPWIASARPGVRTTGGGDPSPPIDEAARTKTLCYMRGLKERVQIHTSSGLPWQWRRICFTMKGDDLYQTDAATQRFSLLTSNGMVRVMNAVDANGAAGTAISGLIFDGSNQGDWTNWFTAKLDTQRITVKSDRTRIIQSGNDSGVLRNYSSWYPMNKNLQFDDDENGSTYVGGRYSQRSKVGMGDYYVIDLISAGTGATTTDLLSFEPEATLYWHEK